MGQKNKTVVKENVMPGEMKYKPAPTVMRKAGQTWLSAAQNTTANIELNQEPDKKWYTSEEQPMTGQEKVRAFLQNPFG